MYGWFPGCRRALAWDCGTGSGQGAVALVAHFTQVIASDPSREQLAHAAAHARVRHLVASAEQPPAEAMGADLVTAAQALHWFDLERFYPALERVLTPGGLFAAWGYGLMRITPQVVWPFFLRLSRYASGRISDSPEPRSFTI